MKKNCLFFLIISIYVQSYGQTNCSDSYSDVNYAYSHVKSAYNSNNLDHLRHYAKRSYDAFVRAKAKLETCNCDKSYNFAYDAVELLSHVEYSETFEDGRFYVKRAKGIAKEVINELELCTELEHDDSDLSQLENEQQKLKQQQLELKRKEEEIKKKLAEHKTQETNLKKEEFINKNEVALNSNITAYNALLSACDCDEEVVIVNVENSSIASKNMKEIKSHYLNVVKEMTSNYLKKLDKCSLR